MKTKVKFFDYPVQFTEYAEEYTRIFREVCGKGAFILGEEVERFEDEFAAFVGAKHAIGVGNCTDGLLISLHAAGIGAGDEVISVSHTFVATIEVMQFLGAKPVFADIAEDHNMDADAVEELITPKTKAIVPVHLNGRICTKMDKLVEIASEHGLVIIEDAAPAIGATYKGRGSGTFGLAGCFSFYPAKLLGTFGDAGAIVTDDDDLAARLRIMRNHSRGERGEVKFWGQNSRMDNLHAAILSFKLSHLEGLIERRRAIARQYQEGLAEIDKLKLPPPPQEDGRHYDVFQNYEIEAEDRDKLVEHLSDKGIEVALPWGGKAVHQFKALGLSTLSLPRTEEHFRKALMIPMYPSLENAHVRYTIDMITHFYG